MGKIACFALITALMSSTSYADWQELSRNEQYATYIDPTTIRSTGTLVKVWTLYDDKKPQVVSNGKQAYSTKMQVEFDCAADQVRVLFIVWNSLGMGEGETLQTSKPAPEWQPFPPNTLFSSQAKIACSVK